MQQPDNVTPAQAAPAAPLDLPEMLTTPRGSNIMAMGFRGGVLYIQFQAGKVYRYFGEGLRDHHSAMLLAESPGKYFHQHLRGNAAIRVEYVGRVSDPIASDKCKCGAAIVPGTTTCPACV
jgi:hypothetical protein